MFWDVPASSKILEEFRQHTTSGFSPLTLEMQTTLVAVDKPKKGGKGSKKGVTKAATTEGPSETANPDPPVRNEEVTPNPEVNPFINDSIPSPPPSPKTTSTPITIAPCPSHVTSSQPTTISSSTPILTDSTTTPITITNPEVTVNISDTGAAPSFFSTYVSSSISPISNDDPDMIFGDIGDDDDLGGFTYSPF
ncbi:unnamed protein product [Lactuca saligna]|uniref:Uncharacterized protein n=1 Tax=Lactuca saligna TaxID=75948 RepID=A0AA35VYR6_LACSI|nr:unnamed protein product [Lactuca saligna]